jgi:hypothetical protein
MKKDFEARLQILKREHTELLNRKNEKVEPGNGIFVRYKYPVLTGAHAPLFWRYDLDSETNPHLMERFGDVSNVLFTNGWIIDDDGTVFIYYASSDTRMHVAVSTIEKLADYCVNTAPDGFRSAASVETLKKIITRNLNIKG